VGCSPLRVGSAVATEPKLIKIVAAKIEPIANLSEAETSGACTLNVEQLSRLRKLS
jgi:hypothetical protein